MSANCSVVSSKNDCCSIYTGKGAPSSSLGANGSIFISETSPYIIYKKVNDNWVVFGSLKGADGSGGSNNIIYSQTTAVPLTGTQTSGSLLTYTLDKDTLSTNGEFISLLGDIFLINQSTDPINEPINILIRYDGDTLASFDYTPTVASWVTLDLKLTRLSGASIFTNCTLFENWGTTGVSGTELSFSGTSSTLSYINVKDTDFLTDKDIDIVVSMVNGTVVLYKGQILQYKVA